MGSKGASLEEFLAMTDREVASIVGTSPLGRTGVLVPDGNRKAGLVMWRLDPRDKGFDRNLFNRIHSRFLNVVKIFFDQGVKDLFIPLLMHSNFERGKGYMKAAMSDGLSHIFKDPGWTAFYRESGIRVRFYGDMDYIREKGHDKLVEWTKELEKETENNEQANIFFGLACTRSLEEVRLARIGGRLRSLGERYPDRSELIREYYGTNAPSIGFFIRPTEVRDSDVQPILLSGATTQMYFPISPVGFLSRKVIRTILFDLIMNRISSGGKKMYDINDMNMARISRIKAYYSSNLETVLGVGRREGPFWLANGIDGTFFDEEADLSSKDPTEPR